MARDSPLACGGAPIRDGPGRARIFGFDRNRAGAGRPRRPARRGGSPGHTSGRAVRDPARLSRPPRGPAPSGSRTEPVGPTARVLRCQAGQTRVTRLTWPKPGHAPFAMPGLRECCEAGPARATWFPPLPAPPWAMLPSVPSPRPRQSQGRQASRARGASAARASSRIAPGASRHGPATGGPGPACVGNCWPAHAACAGPAGSDPAARFDGGVKLGTPLRTWGRVRGAVGS